MRFFSEKSGRIFGRKFLYLAAVVFTSSASAHSLAGCERVTHISHGGVEAHEDLGGNKVAWTAWWSQEGVSKDVWLADCRTGIALSLRTHEERISDRYIVDRTEKVRAEITRQAELSPALFTIERMASVIRKDGRDMMITQYDDEFCACHAAYPDLRGEKTGFGGHS